MVMQRKQHLFIPGPTPVPPEVAAAMTRPVIGHRSSEYASLQRSLTEKVKQVFQTKNHLFILTSSGTGAMEAAVTSSLSPGDKVLALITGQFGQRFAAIAEQCGAQVEPMEFPWGEAVEIEKVQARLERGPLPQAVLVTHNETSTGVVNDVAAIGALLKNTPTPVSYTHLDVYKRQYLRGWAKSNPDSRSDPGQAYQRSGQSLDSKGRTATQRPRTAERQKRFAVC